MNKKKIEKKFAHSVMNNLKKGALEQRLVFRSSNFFILTVFIIVKKNKTCPPTRTAVDARGV